MKKVLFVLILLTSFGLFAEKPVVAVLEIDNKTAGKNKLSNYDAELIADLMRDELIQSNELTVMSRDDMESAIAQHVKKSHQLNKDKNYAIELGKQISARYIITSQIKTDGKIFRIFAEIIDTEKGSSDRSGKAKFAMDDDSKDSAIANLIRQLLGERDESFRPKKSEDQIDCENARVENIAESWEAYLTVHPKGICAHEAKEKLDEMDCQKAVRVNTIEVWEDYLDNRNGKCKIEAIKNIKKLKNTASRNQNTASGFQQNPSSAAITAEKIGDLYWSDKAPKKMNFNEARNYCRRLNEGGITEWRLPDINELRILIQNCPASLSGSSCRSNNSGEYSVLGDTENLWSSSFKSDSKAYIVDFLKGGIDDQHIGNTNNVRCVK